MPVDLGYEYTLIRPQSSLHRIDNITSTGSNARLADQNAMERNQVVNRVEFMGTFLFTSMADMHKTV